MRRIIGPQDSAERSIGRIMRARAHAFMAHPEEWRDAGALTWRNVETGELITDQLVHAVRTADQMATSKPGPAKAKAPQHQGKATPDRRRRTRMTVDRHLFADLGAQRTINGKTYTLAGYALCGWIRADNLDEATVALAAAVTEKLGAITDELERCDSSGATSPSRTSTTSPS
jgi:hypothetical protein